eukprot:jgi/Botrbrau1/23206/Bobra.0041s0050.1
MSQNDDIILNISSFGDIEPLKRGKYSKFGRGRKGRDGGQNLKGHSRGRPGKHDGLRKLPRPVHNKEGNQMKGYSLDTSPPHVPLASKPGKQGRSDKEGLEQTKRGFQGQQITIKPAVPQVGDGAEKAPKRRRQLPANEVNNPRRHLHEDKGQAPKLPKQRPSHDLPTESPAHLKAGGSPESNHFEEEEGDEGVLYAAISSSMRKDAALAHSDPEQEANMALPGQETASDISGQAGFLSFVDERRPPAVARKAKRKKPSKESTAGEGSQRIPVKRKKEDIPKRGEFVHVGAPQGDGTSQEAVHAAEGQDGASVPARPLFPTFGAIQGDVQPLGGTLGLWTLWQYKLLQYLYCLVDGMPSFTTPTGSGKTLAYLAPLVDHLQRRQPRIQTGAGHLRPAAGTHQGAGPPGTGSSEMYCCAASTGWWPAPCTWRREPFQREGSAAQGVSVVVATPGRLLDHLKNTAAFRVAHLEWLVLDEADRLLDLGFHAKIAEIMAMLDKRRGGGGRGSRQTVAAVRYNALQA